MMIFFWSHITLVLIFISSEICKCPIYFSLSLSSLFSLTKMLFPPPSLFINNLLFKSLSFIIPPLTTLIHPDLNIYWYEPEFSKMEELKHLFFYNFKKLLVFSESRTWLSHNKLAHYSPEAFKKHKCDKKQRET